MTDLRRYFSNTAHISQRQKTVLKFSFSSLSARLWIFTLLIVGPGLLVAEHNPGKNVGGVEITEIEVIFDEGDIQFEGSVKSHRKKPIPGLVIRLEFFDSTGALLNILNQAIEENVVKKGDEVDFYLVCDEVPRAVSFQVIVFSGKRMQLRTSRGGPYPL